MRYLIVLLLPGYVTEHLRVQCYFLTLIVYPILKLTKNGVLDIPMLLAS